MTLPGFTADASLSKTTNRYRTHVQRHGYAHRVDIIPQLGGRGFVGRAACYADCADAHPDWSAARCAARCRDPGGIRGSGSAQTRDFASRAMCYGGYALCKSVGFSAFRPDLWVSCLFGGPCTCEDLYDGCLAR